MNSVDARARERDRQSGSRGLLVSGLGHAINVLEPLLTLLLIRMTSAAVWGLFLLAESIGYAACRVASLGLERGMMWEIARSREGEEIRIKGLGGALLIGGGLGLAIAALGQLALPWLIGTYFEEPEALGAARIILWTTPISVLVSVLVFSAQGLQSVLPRTAVNQVTVPLITRGLPLALLWTGHSVAPAHELIAIGHLVGNISALCVAAILLKRRMRETQASIVKGAFWPSRALLRYSVPSGLAELLSTLMVRIDVWMLAALMDAAAVGLYGVILALSKALRTLRLILTPIVTPIMSEATFEGQRQRARTAFARSTYLVTWIAAPIMVSLWALAPTLLALYGEEFARGEWPLLVLCLGTLIHVVFGLGSAVVAGSGRADLLVLNQALPIGLNLLLNLWLIPALGVLGAATATASSLAFMSLLELGFARRVLGVRLWTWWVLEPLGISALGVAIGASMVALSPVASASLIGRLLVLSAFVLIFGRWSLTRGKRLYQRR